jgi:hypothetical protein
MAKPECGCQALKEKPHIAAGIKTNQDMPHRYEPSFAIVTGAFSGIGFALAMEAAGDGCDLLVF